MPSIHHQDNFIDKIFYQDCAEGLKILPNSYFDCIIVDPPYNIGKEFSDTCRDNMALSDYIIWLKQILDECLRVLKKDKLIYLYGYSEILAYIAVQYNIDNQRWLIWHYKNKATPTSRFWQRSYETILCLWQDDKPILNIDKIREPYSDTFLKNSAGKIRKETLGRFSNGNKKTIYNAHRNGALPRDVIKIPALAGGAGLKERLFYCRDCDYVYHSCDRKKHDNHSIIFHPTQKPNELTQRLLLSCAEQDAKILIPFAGSGSECIVAKKLSMYYTAFEINDNYLQMAVKWLEKYNKENEDCLMQENLSLF